MKETFSIFYSIPYLIFAIVLIVLSIIEQKKGTKHRLFIAVLFLFFFGLRGFIGYDWYGYYPYFQDASNIFNLKISDFFEFVNVGELVEPGFVIYTSIIKTFFDNWYVFIFISTLLDFIVFDFVFKKYSPNYAFSFLILFSFNISMEVDLLRNIKAVLLLMFSLQSIYDRKLLKFLLFTLLAFLFHRMSLIFLPLYFFANHKYCKKTLTLIFIVFNILYFIDFSFLENLLELIGGYFGNSFASRIYWYGMSDEYSSERGFTFGYFYRIATFILIIKYSNYLYSNYRYSNIFINLFLIYSLVSFVFNDFEVFVFRLELIFSISFWFLWPLLLQAINEIKIKRLVFTIMILICFLKTYKQTNNLMYDYENILLNSSTYEQRYSSHFVNSYKINNK